MDIYGRLITTKNYSFLILVLLFNNHMEEEMANFRTLALTQYSQFF